MMKLSANTGLIALFGYPTGHSLSPAMHNAAFKEMGLELCYLTFDVHPQELRDAVLGARAMGFVGLNVTVPHKEAIMPMLGEVRPEAAFIGAVNTVLINERGKLIGHNTDGMGFMKSLEDEGIDPAGKRVLVIGSGGASRAICSSLCEAASEVAVYNRTQDRAARLVADLGINFKNATHLESMSGEAVACFDMVINATSLGLSDGDPLPLDATMLRQGQIVGDLIYKNTPFLAHAQKMGHRTFNGLGMLLWQGVLSSQIWTGQMPPVETMRRALKEKFQ